MGFLELGCVVALFAMAQDSKPAARRDLWILAGQSNMEGNGYLDDAMPDPNVSVFGFRSDRWEPSSNAIHGAHDGSPGGPGWGTGPVRAIGAKVPKGVGPGLAFARERVKRTQVPIGLIPCAVGGTSLEEWSPSKASDPKSLYGKMLARVRAAGGSPAGFLWYQGEADAIASPEAAASYGARFEAFIAALRRDLQSPDLPVGFVQLSRYASQDGSKAAAWNAVQEAQLRIPERVAHTAVVAAIDLPLDDPIHVSASGEHRIGVRLAKAMSGVLGPRPVSAKFEAGRRDAIRVSYSGVNGKLRPAERVLGFTLLTREGAVLDSIFDAAVDPTKPTSVVLRLSADAPAGARLQYGRGLDPACNLVDDEDLAAPAFAPISVEP